MYKERCYLHLFDRCLPHPCPLCSQKHRYDTAIMAGWRGVYVREGVRGRASDIKQNQTEPKEIRLEFHYRLVLKFIRCDALSFRYNNRR